VLLGNSSRASPPQVALKFVVGVCMNSRNYLVFAVLAAILSLSSCSGVKNKGGGGGGGGNAMLSVSISDTPPANTTVVSFTLPIIAISLTSSSGTQVSVPISAQRPTLN